jgi:glycosyltransferase involved in cell wall biosynthesis
VAEKIRLLHVVNGLAIGGAENHLLQSLRVTDRSRYNVMVCSVRQGGPLERAFLEAGVPVRVIAQKMRFDPTVVTRLARLYRQWKPHLVQTTLYYADMVGVLAARLAPGPVLISVEHGIHGEGDVLRVTPRHVLAYRWAMKRVKRVVAVSGHIHRSLLVHRHLPDSQVVTIRNGFDASVLPAADRAVKRREFGFGEEDWVVGMVARMDPVKGHAVLLKALPGLMAGSPRLKCLLVGDGPLRPDLEAGVRKEDLEKHVVFTGFRRDVAEILACVDVLVLPSFSEGLPMILLEAMACRVPVIASDVGGVPEIITHGYNGLLVKPGEAGSLGEALLFMIRNREEARRMGEAGRSRVLGEFSLEKEAEAYGRLYRSCLENGNLRGERP